MNSHHDSNSYQMFALVLGALVLFTLFIMVIANWFSPSADPFGDPLVYAQQQERLLPVGKSRVAP